MHMPKQVPWLLICSLMTTVHGQSLDNCLLSREAYANLNLGDAEEVPENFAEGMISIMIHDN